MVLDSSEIRFDRGVQTQDGSPQVGSSTQCWSTPLKITFRGWKREVKEHAREVRRVIKDAKGDFTAGKKDDSLEWDDGFTAFGRLDDLALTGSFLVELNFSAEELKDWIRKYIADKPKEALKLLARMQAEAIIEVSNR